MKLLMNILLAAVAAQAHCRLVVNGKPKEKDWNVTRMTKNAQSQQGVESATSGDIRCYSAQTAGSVATVPAGSTIRYISTQQINHPGPTQYYLAKVPTVSSATNFDGSGAVWFKIFTTMPTMDKKKQLTRPGQNEYTTVNATIPSNVPSGEYLLRVEQIALHMASQPNKAQFYIACSQIQITGGGNGNPEPLVSLPGAYKPNDPGILVNLHNMQPDAYQPPGPSVWKS
ncbi:glycoside hydrolase [Copromyces sp. CBS 386.78]|nr:glycoside hydrolase [Copromyces sp. CBS 386.78]